jgi:hypothetical protein
MIVSHLIEVVLIALLGFLLRWENKKRDRIQSQMPGGLEGRDLDSTAFLDLTDRENLKYVSFFTYKFMTWLTGISPQFPLYILVKLSSTKDLFWL